LLREIELREFYKKTNYCQSVLAHERILRYTRPETMALGTRGSGTIIPYHCANSVPSPFAAAFRREKNSSKKTLLFFLPSAVANPRLGMIFVPIIEDQHDKISVIR